MKLDKLGVALFNVGCHASSNQSSMEKKIDVIYRCNSEGLQDGIRNNICYATEFKCPERPSGLENHHHICLELRKDPKEDRNMHLNSGEGYDRYLILSNCESKAPHYLLKLYEYSPIKIIDCLPAKEGEKDEDCDIKLNLECEPLLSDSSSWIDLLFSIAVATLVIYLSSRPHVFPTHD